MSLSKRIRAIFRRQPVTYEDAVAGREAQAEVDRKRAQAEHHFQSRSVQNNNWFM